MCIGQQGVFLNILLGSTVASHRTGIAKLAFHCGRVFLAMERPPLKKYIQHIQKRLSHRLSLYLFLRRETHASYFYMQRSFFILNFPSVVYFPGLACLSFEQKESTERRGKDKSSSYILNDQRNMQPEIILQ